MFGLSWSIFQSRISYSGFSPFANNASREHLPSSYLLEYSQFFNAIGLDYTYTYRMGSFRLSPGIGFSLAIGRTPKSITEFGYDSLSRWVADVETYNYLTESSGTMFGINLGLGLYYQVSKKLQVGIQTSYFRQIEQITSFSSLPVVTELDVNDRTYRFSPAKSLAQLNYSLRVMYLIK